MSGLVERCARAGTPEAAEAWDEQIEYIKSLGYSDAEALKYAANAHKSYRPEVSMILARQRARATLAAALPPTEAMIEAGMDAYEENFGRVETVEGCVINIFTAMLNAELDPKEGE